MERTKIYYLHKENNIPFYVGKTKSKLQVRLNSHKNRLNNFNIHISEIDDVNTSEWKFWESFWIEQFKQWGFQLENKNNGGGGLAFHSKETKLKISKMKKGKISPFKGKKLSKEIKEKISISKTGYKASTETKLKISKALKGKPLSKEHKEKIKQTREFLKERENTWANKPVIQMDKKGNFIREFGSQKEAQYIMRKPNMDGIGACCRGKQKTAYGYKWKFK